MSCYGQVFPLDAGTDNGFTFTSPNWETEPRAEVVAIFKSAVIVLVILILAIISVKNNF